MNLTTYERYSHEGISTRKKLKKYLARQRKKQAKKNRNSTIVSHVYTNKSREEDMTLSENQRTTNTMNKGLLEECSTGKSFIVNGI